MTPSMDRKFRYSALESPGIQRPKYEALAVPQTYFYIQHIVLRRVQGAIRMSLRDYVRKIDLKV